MIVPMKKVFLVVLEKGLKDTLKKLRKLGLVHLEQVEGNGAKLDSLKNELVLIQNAISLLSEQKPPKGAKNVPVSTDLPMARRLEIANEILALSEKKKNCLAQISADSIECEKFEKWGSVDPSDFEYLKEKGIKLSLYEIPTDRYSSIGEDVGTLLVNSDKNQTRFLVIGEDDERSAGLPPEAYKINLPTLSTDKLNERVKENKKSIKDIEDKLLAARCYLPLLNEAAESYSKDIEFETVYSGMGKDADPESDNVPLGALAWISGYIPTDDLEALKSEAKAQSWALQWMDPADDDENVPTKLKNNKLVNLIYPVSDFLGTVPGYHEYDISNWFLLFFTIFFAMIFGDAGYGALLSVVAILGIFSAVAKKKAVAPVMKLLLLIGVATIAWGAVTCTWFGIDPTKLPPFLTALSVPALSNAVSKGIVTAVGIPSYLSGEQWVKENLQIFCFSLALIQLSIAHLKGIIRYRKSLKCVGEFGSLIMLWGMFYIVLSMVVDGVRFPLSAEGSLVIGGVPLPTICIGLIGAGFFLSFCFSNYSGSVLKSILESCKNIVSVLLGVVNVFSDIVSYIRLWAVALAGSAISDTVNTMAGPMLGKAIFFLGILLLVFGHGLNMVLNVLSVIVHGVRLNTLEFSTHLGMSWSGFKYKPFSEK